MYNFGQESIRNYKMHYHYLILSCPLSHVQSRTHDSFHTPFNLTTRDRQKPNYKPKFVTNCECSLDCEMQFGLLSGLPSANKFTWVWVHSVCECLRPRHAGIWGNGQRGKPIQPSPSLPATFTGGGRRGKWFIPCPSLGASQCLTIHSSLLSDLVKGLKQPC